MPNDLRWTTTAWCREHQRLEPVEDVIEVHRFQVHRNSAPTGKHGAEVRARSEQGCRLHFIGGSAWLR